MTTMFSTKKALISSIVALVMCFSMLLGTTFAWFTDSVTSSGNIIQSGTLKVGMDWADGKVDPATADWADASKTTIFEYAKWEPGYVQVRHVKISNNGTLALKYQVKIIADGEVSKLADVIDVYYVDPAVAVTDRTALTDENKLGTLTEVLAGFDASASGMLPAGENHTVTIALKMQELAGNEYQNLSVGGSFSVQLLATQATYEEDSFGTDYDADAEYPCFVYSNEELTDALANGETKIQLGAGTYTFPASSLSGDETIICAPGTVFEGTSSLNINGATVVGATFDAGNKDTSVSGTINGTFKDCTFTGGSEGVRWCYTNAGDTVIFENCVFEATLRGIHFDGMDGDVKFINCEVNGFNAIGGSGTVTFEGCTFGNDQSRYNGLNMYCNTVLTDCTFNFVNGKTNFIDFEAAGMSLTITNCTATLDGTAVNVLDFVGGTYKDQTTITVDGVQQ